MNKTGRVGGKKFAVRTVASLVALLMVSAGAWGQSRNWFVDPNAPYNPFLNYTIHSHYNQASGGGRDAIALVDVLEKEFGGSVLTCHIFENLQTSFAVWAEKHKVGNNYTVKVRFAVLKKAEPPVSILAQDYLFIASDKLVERKYAKDFTGMDKLDGTNKWLLFDAREEFRDYTGSAIADVIDALAKDVDVLQLNPAAAYKYYRFHRIRTHFSTAEWDAFDWVFTPAVVSAWKRQGTSYYFVEEKNLTPPKDPSEVIGSGFSSSTLLMAGYYRNKLGDRRWLNNFDVPPGGMTWSDCEGGINTYEGSSFAVLDNVLILVLHGFQYETRTGEALWGDELSDVGSAVYPMLSLGSVLFFHATEDVDIEALKKGEKNEPGGKVLRDYEWRFLDAFKFKTRIESMFVGGLPDFIINCTDFETKSDMSDGGRKIKFARLLGDVYTYSTSLTATAMHLDDWWTIPDPNRPDYSLFEKWHDEFADPYVSVAEYTIRHFYKDIYTKRLCNPTKMREILKDPLSQACVQDWHAWNNGLGLAEPSSCLTFESWQAKDCLTPGASPEALSKVVAKRFLLDDINSYYSNIPRFDLTNFGKRAMYMNANIYYGDKPYLRMEPDYDETGRKFLDKKPTEHFSHLAWADAEFAENFNVPGPYPCFWDDMPYRSVIQSLTGIPEGGLAGSWFMVDDYPADPNAPTYGDYMICALIMDGEYGAGEDFFFTQNNCFTLMVFYCKGGVDKNALHYGTRLPRDYDWELVDAVRVRSLIYEEVWLTPDKLNLSDNGIDGVMQKYAGTQRPELLIHDWVPTDNHVEAISVFQFGVQFSWFLADIINAHQNAMKQGEPYTYRKSGIDPAGFYADPDPFMDFITLEVPAILYHMREVIDTHDDPLIFFHTPQLDVTLLGGLPMGEYYDLRNFGARALTMRDRSDKVHGGHYHGAWYYLGAEGTDLGGHYLFMAAQSKDSTLVTYNVFYTPTTLGLADIKALKKGTKTLDDYTWVYLDGVLRKGSKYDVVAPSESTLHLLDLTTWWQGHQGVITEDIPPKVSVPLPATAEAHEYSNVIAWHLYRVMYDYSSRLAAGNNTPGYYRDWGDNLNYTPESWVKSAYVFDAHVFFDGLGLPAADQTALKSFVSKAFVERQKLKR
jgi:hypothetical protein